MNRRPFRPSVHALEPRIALSSSSFFNNFFSSLLGTKTLSSSSKPKTAPHNLAYYEKLAPTNARAAHVVQVVMQQRQHAAELKAEHAAQHVHG